jgi:hypothetical protein
MHNSLYYVQSYDWEHDRRKRILISAINEELARALVRLELGTYFQIEHSRLICETSNHVYQEL